MEEVLPKMEKTLIGADGKSFRASLAEFVVVALTGGIKEDEVEREALAQVQKLHSYVGYLALNDSSLLSGKAQYAGRNASSIADMDRLESALRQSVMVVRLGREGVRPEVVADISKIRANISTERISEKGKSGSGTAAIAVGFFLAFMLYMSIMLHGQNAMRGVLEEKMTRVA